MGGRRHQKPAVGHAPRFVESPLSSGYQEESVVSDVSSDLGAVRGGAGGFRKDELFWPEDSDRTESTESLAPSDLGAVRDGGGPLFGPGMRTWLPAASLRSDTTSVVPHESFYAGGCAPPNPPASSLAGSHREFYAGGFVPPNPPASCTSGETAVRSSGGISSTGATKDKPPYNLGVLQRGRPARTPSPIPSPVKRLDPRREVLRRPWSAQGGSPSSTGALKDSARAEFVRQHGVPAWVDGLPSHARGLLAPTPPPGGVSPARRRPPPARPPNPSTATSGSMASCESEETTFLGRMRQSSGLGSLPSSRLSSAPSEASPASNASLEEAPSVLGTAAAVLKSSFSGFVGTRWLAMITETTRTVLREGGRGPIKMTVPICGIFCRGYSHELSDAIHDDDPQAVRRIVRLGADPNQTHGIEQAPAIVFASRYGKANALKALLECGADIAKLTAFGNHALTIAVLFGRPEVIRVLTNHGTDPDRVAKCPSFLRFFGKRFYQNRPLHMASSFNEYLPSVKALLEAKADPRLKNGEGKTPLECVGKSSEAKKIALLLTRWAKDHPAVQKAAPTD